MKNIIIIFILIILTNSYSRNTRSDSLYLALYEKTIFEMTINEYQYFKNANEECDNFNACADKHLLQILNKQPAELSDNELDYVEDIMHLCDTLNPCELSLCKYLTTLESSGLSEIQKSMYDECEEECKDWMEEQNNPHSKKKKIIFFSILGLVLFATGIFLLFEIY